MFAIIGFCHTVIPYLYLQMISVPFPGMTLELNFDLWYLLFTLIVGSNKVKEVGYCPCLLQFLTPTLP